MTNTEMIRKINELNELESLLKEAKAEAEAIKDLIVEEMERQETEELICGQYIIRNTTYVKSVFDGKQFRKDYNEVYKMFLRQTTAKRFSITC